MSDHYDPNQWGQGPASYPVWDSVNQQWLQPPPEGYDPQAQGYFDQQQGWYDPQQQAFIPVPDQGWGAPAAGGWGEQPQAAWGDQAAAGWEQPQAEWGAQPEQGWGEQPAAGWDAPAEQAWGDQAAAGWGEQAAAAAPQAWTEPSPVDPSAAYLPPAEMYAGGGTSQYGMNLGYAVDIVFVIDITGSMTPVIEQVKAGALSFHEQLMATMAQKDKFVSNLRLRVVAYRDYYDNASDALFHTPFFRLPDEAQHFHSYVSGLFADGGGDEPESGLEGLGVAMASDWERGMDRRRHVIVVFTDASAHPLEASHDRPVPGYPTHIPTTFDGLTDQWDDPQGHVMEFAAKRLLLYAPDVYPWNVISANWDNVLHYPSSAGKGLNEVEFGQIIDAIAGSV